MQQKERTYYGDTSTVLYAGGSTYVPSVTPEYAAQYESSTTNNYPYIESSATADDHIINVY